MDTVATYIPTHPFFVGVDSGLLEPATRCAAVLAVAGGQRLFYQGEPAMNMYLVRTGRFALRAQGASRTAVTVDAVGDGEVVGWSWMVPPYRWMFDAVATQDSTVVALDAACLRQACDDSPELGYEVMKRISMVMHHRLAGARERLLNPPSKDHHGPQW